MCLCMCFLWHLGQWVLANHLMVLTFLLVLLKYPVGAKEILWFSFVFNILLEFPKQIKTVLFWDDLRLLPVTRLIFLVQSRNQVISRFFQRVIRSISPWFISLGNMETCRGYVAFFSFRTYWTIFFLWQSKSVF